MKIKELPVTLQPRERLLQYGVENLSDVDLLSIILRTGVKDINVKDLSLSILKELGGLNKLSNVGIRELSKIKGMGTVKAETLLAAIELGKRVSNREIVMNMPLNNNKLVHETFKRLFIDLNQEKVLAIYLDTKKRLISYKFIFTGTLDKSLIHPREIFNEAIKISASSIILIHNHPSGDITPSEDDINITKKIKESGNIIGIPLIDHIITNGKDYYSFYDELYKK